MTEDRKQTGLFRLIEWWYTVGNDGWHNSMAKSIDKKQILWRPHMLG